MILSLVNILYRSIFGDTLIQEEVNNIVSLASTLREV